MDSAVLVSIVGGSFALLNVGLTALINYLNQRKQRKTANIEDLVKQYDEVREDLQKIKVGVQSSLRNDIVSYHTIYTRQQYCPLSAKEAISRAYNAYHDLGGNDIATELFEEIKDLPLTPPSANNDEINIHIANPADRIKL